MSVATTLIFLEELIKEVSVDVNRDSLDYIKKKLCCEILTRYSDIDGYCKNVTTDYKESGINGFLAILFGIDIELMKKILKSLELYHDYNNSNIKACIDTPII